MPLKKGKSNKVVKANIAELAGTKPGATRAKAIKTLAKKRGISTKKAKVIQAVAIAKNKAGLSRTKRKESNRKAVNKFRSKKR